MEVDNFFVYTFQEVPLGVVRAIAGISLIVLGAISVLLQLQLIYVIVAYRDFRTSLTYFIIAVTTVTEIPENVLHCYSGFFVFWDTPAMYQVSKVVSSVCEGFFFASISSNLALALNRLDIFKPPGIPSKYHFTVVHTCTIVAIGVVIGIVFTAIAFSPLLTVFFDHERMSLRFDGPLRDFVPGFLFWSTTILVTVILACYLLIFCSIVVKRKQHTGAKISVNEVKLLISAAFQFFTMFISVLSLNFQQLLPPVVVFCNTLFLSGLQPIIHVLINRKLRRRYLKGIHLAPSFIPKHSNPFLTAITTRLQVAQFGKSKTSNTSVQSLRY